MRNWTSRTAAALAVLSLAAPAVAQTSRIGGVVRDETGATIRGAVVRAETGGGRTFGAPVTLTTVSDERGRFVFVINRSGEWRVTFEAPGFDPMTIPLAIRLTGAPPSLDVKLERRETPEAFGALAGLDSKLLSAQIAAAGALYDQGKHDEAIAAYREIKAKAPAISHVNLQIANSLIVKRSYAEAETAIQEALKADEADTSALFAMGTLREAQGNAADAKVWFEKAAATDGMWTRPLMKLASIATSAGDRATAARHLARVVDLDPGSADGKAAAELLKQ